MWETSAKQKRQKEIHVTSPVGVNVHPYHRNRDSFKQKAPYPVETVASTITRERRKGGPLLFIWISVNVQTLKVFVLYLVWWQSTTIAAGVGYFLEWIYISIKIGNLPDVSNSTLERAQKIKTKAYIHRKKKYVM